MKDVWSVVKFDVPSFVAYYFLIGNYMSTYLVIVYAVSIY